MELRWRPGPAQGDRTTVYCGDDFLVAVAVRDSRDAAKQWWEYAVVTITEDGCEVDGSPWGWSWEDVEWYIPATELAPTPRPASGCGPAA